MRLFDAVEPHMGTLVQIKLYSAGPEAAQSAVRAAFDRIAQLDDELSDYKPESELNRLCESAVRRPQKVSTDLFAVLDFSQEMAQETNGAFDVTLGPLTHLWRESRRQRHVPTAGEIRAKLAHCGFRKMHLDRLRRTVELDEAGMQLDVGGVAKGYAADEALVVLKRLGGRSALVAMSGDLAFDDPPPGQNGWKIGIDSLDKAGQPFTRVLLLANAAVSTSGDTEQHLDASGKRYSHIVDPRTGLGLTDSKTVTVIAPRGMEADAAATAVSVLGIDAGLAFVEGKPRMAALLTAHKRGVVRLVESKRWRSVESAR